MSPEDFSLIEKKNYFNMNHFLRFCRFIYEDNKKSILFTLAGIIILICVNIHRINVNMSIFEYTVATLLLGLFVFVASILITMVSSFIAFIALVIIDSLLNIKNYIVTTWNKSK